MGFADRAWSVYVGRTFVVEYPVSCTRLCHCSRTVDLFAKTNYITLIILNTTQVPFFVSSIIFILYRATSF